MADVYTTKLNVLRKKSRSFLSQLEENSRLVEDEIRKLSINSVNSPRNCVSEPNPHEPSSSWRIRNDSSGVNGLLNPCNSLNKKMTVGGRILISSKRVGNSSGPRRPVPGCYCTRRPKKVRYRSANTIYKAFEPCHYCKSQCDVFRAEAEAPHEAPVSPALSCETLKKVQGISYTPRSEFLRKVQRKVSGQFVESICPEQSARSLRSLRESSSRSSQRNQEIQDERNESRVLGAAFSEDVRNETENVKINRRNEGISIQLDSTIIDPPPGDLVEVPVEVHRSDTSSISPEVHDVDDSVIDRSRKSRDKSSSKSIRPKHREHPVETHPRDFSPEIETILPPRVSHKSERVAKKTISSTNRDDKEKEGKGGKSREKSEKVVRTLSQRSCYDACCVVNERRRGSKKSRECADCCGHGDRCLSRLASGVIPLGEDRETLELRKFREKNYFDTHESSHAIPSCESKGFLEQFELNSRLFPEPVGRLAKDNIVVSMPPCATTQLKMIHYFPRNIVREDKRGISNCNKKRHKSCPLTGHAIDLGVLKTPCPANSLALKYQKGVV
ncbi:uncharacterized protein LOC107035770 [Diachasma alloeum]|uniref:uncharacterized protein LOC107035770 n=1 Tax=Diachasma alloeum TaxID=454923 RepID=UPI0007381B0E|nr:uncharacterized protein LOC107035770 [Diachasma alloeum]